MLGAVAIILVLVVLGPIAVMMGGAAWSGLVGWLVSEDADQHG